MFVDLLPLHAGPIKPPLDISPRRPVQYQLRAVVWGVHGALLSKTTMGKKVFRLSRLAFARLCSHRKNWQHLDLQDLLNSAAIFCLRITRLRRSSTLFLSISALRFVVFLHISALSRHSIWPRVIWRWSNDLRPPVGWKVPLRNMEGMLPRNSHRGEDAQTNHHNL